MSGAKDVPSWYFGKVSKEYAHERLIRAMSGTYLLRDNETSKGNYVLSLNENGMIVDYEVRKVGRTWKAHGRDFADLEGLIGYFQKYALDTVSLDIACSKEGMESPPTSPSWHK